MNSEELTRVHRLLSEGNTPEKVADEFGIHYTTLLRKLNAAGYRIEITRCLVPIIPVGMSTSTEVSR